MPGRGHPHAWKGGCLHTEARAVTGAHRRPTFAQWPHSELAWRCPCKKRAHAPVCPTPAPAILQVVGLLAPDSHTGATLRVRNLSHEDADSSVMIQRQLGGSASRHHPPGSDKLQTRGEGASGIRSGGHSFMRVSHSVLLVEAWEAVEGDPSGHEKGDQEQQQQQQQQGSVQADVNRTPTSSSSSGSEVGHGQHRRLQDAVVTDLPPSDPRQCIFPS